MLRSGRDRETLRRCGHLRGRCVRSGVRTLPVRPVRVWVTRLTTASVVAYLLTVWLIDGPIDLTGALTALLVTQASATASLKMGVVRVGAVLTGVLVAVTLTSWVGLSWWTLAAAVASAQIGRAHV